MTKVPSAPGGISEQAVESFWETIPPLWGTIRAHIRATATQRFNITVEQFQVLRYVRRGPGSMSELAAAKNISRPAISQAAEILVKKGLVKRVGRAQDRRYVELELTRAGNDLLDTVFDETRAWMRQGMKALSRDELQSIIGAMAVLKKVLAPAPVPYRTA
jgi:DNA-binding MarR family transcriptional regulator